MRPQQLARAWGRIQGVVSAKSFVGSNQSGDVGSRRRGVRVGNGVVEEGVVIVAGKGRDKRANSLRVALAARRQA